jgi:hypothetical protein
MVYFIISYQISRTEPRLSRVRHCFNQILTLFSSSFFLLYNIAGVITPITNNIHTIAAINKIISFYYIQI